MYKRQHYTSSKSYSILHTLSLFSFQWFLKMNREEGRAGTTERRWLHGRNLKCKTKRWADENISHVQNSLEMCQLSLSIWSRLPSFCMSKTESGMNIRDYLSLFSAFPFIRATSFDIINDYYSSFPFSLSLRLPFCLFPVTQFLLNTVYYVLNSCLFLS